MLSMIAESCAVVDGELLDAAPVPRRSPASTADVLRAVGLEVPAPRRSPGCPIRRYEKMAAACEAESAREKARRDARRARRFGESEES